MMQTVIATIVVLSAGFWVARRVYRVVRSVAGDRGAGNCGSCGSCSANRNLAPERQAVPLISIGRKTSSFQPKD